MTRTIIPTKWYAMSEACRITGKIHQKMNYYIKTGFIKPKEIMTSTWEANTQWQKKVILWSALERILMFYP